MRGFVKFKLRYVMFSSVNNQLETLSFPLPFALLRVVAQAHYLKDFFLVQIFETPTGKYLSMILLCEQKACFLQPLTVKRVSVLEDLAYRVHVDVLG